MNPWPTSACLARLRIRNRRDFHRIYRRRCTAADENLLVYGGPNGLPYPRLGMSVSRKLGNAVLRNRWRRLAPRGLPAQPRRSCPRAWT